MHELTWATLHWQLQCSCRTNTGVMRDLCTMSALVPSEPTTNQQPTCSAPYCMLSACRLNAAFTTWQAQAGLDDECMPISSSGRDACVVLQTACASLRLSTQTSVLHNFAMHMHASSRHMLSYPGHFGNWLDLHAGQDDATGLFVVTQSETLLFSVKTSGKVRAASLSFECLQIMLWFTS